MEKKKENAVQLSLLVSEEVPWHALPEELRCQVIELLAHWFKTKLNSERKEKKEEARDA